MSKKSKQPELSGLVVVDKPLGVTSHDVVAAVRGELHMRRVGHAGTLDPQASGVLVIGFGHGTRLLNYIVDHTKTYEATIRLGQSSTTDDSEGEITTVASVRLAGDSSNQGLNHSEHSGSVRVLTTQQIEQVIKEHLTGDIEQVPSSYSAVRVNGHHAYELARQGKAVELKARPVTISEFTVLGARNVDNNDDESIADTTAAIDVDVRISCSTGTYIRSLGRDLGQLLGVGGYLTKLRRTRVGRFDLADSQLAGRVVTAHAKPHTFTNREGVTLTLNKAVLDVDTDELKRRSLTMLEATQRTMPTIPITDADAQNLRFGRRLRMPLAAEMNARDCADTEVADNSAPTAEHASDRILINAKRANSFVAVYIPQTGEVVGILEPTNDHELKSVVVFPAAG
ncbi:tRNA pseudouridine(55) synthase TruB [Bifidobacterium sp. ESL0682]|uniref:tRNA pseudouridine synthase B n=1 Tax=Bifidobacterium sp. ESL0682 TaxID=2983212 RepID=UPI0023F70244|nr:tRNA pseudouridine(55) synthase TruB [Bifidobacterium sp. ESL0682]WEV42353.1 tRNA pseudouridine(55) synthase TruB [Bifidobacterium sp. ESL0682]